MRLSPISTPVSVAGGNAATTDRLAACPWLGTSPSGRCLSFDWKQLFSYQSFMPAAAGTPRYENWVHWLMEGFGCRLCPPPLAGDKPQPYISLSTLGCRCSGDGGWCRRPAAATGRAALAGDPQPYISLFRLAAGAGHPGSESGTCFRANDAHETGPHRSEQLRSIRLFDRRWSRDYTQNSLTLPKFGYR